MAYTPINWDENLDVTAVKLDKMDNQIDVNEQRLTDIDNKTSGTVTNNLQGQIDANEDDISNLFSLKNIKTANGSFSGTSPQQDTVNINSAYILQIKINLSLKYNSVYGGGPTVSMKITNTPLIPGGEEIKQDKIKVDSSIPNDSRTFYYNDIFFTNGNLVIDYSPESENAKSIDSASGSYEIKYIELF